MIKVYFTILGDLQTFLEKNRFLEENYANFITKVYNFKKGNNMRINILIQK